MTTNTENNQDKPLSRLLVVDDDPDTILVLKIGLTEYGFLVEAFTNPEEALRHFKSNPNSYSLVVSDSGIPVLSGIDLAKKVKQINPKVKVLLLTGFGLRDIGYSEDSHSTGRVVDSYVQKPIPIEKLRDKILNLLDETKGRSSFKG